MAEIDKSGSHVDTGSSPVELKEHFMYVVSVSGLFS